MAKAPVARKSVDPNLHQGEVIHWNTRKRFGWIKSRQDVSKLEGGDKNDGKIFVHANDLTDRHQDLFKGMKVEFNLYSDDKGLGATAVRPYIPSGGVPPSGGGPGMGAVPPTRGSGGGFGGPPPMRQRFGGPPPKRGRRNDSLPQRSFVDANVHMGQVIHWNDAKGFGWIRPRENLSHLPGAGKEAKVFVHRNDILAVDDYHKNLAAGMYVEFTVYSDSKGLGATEVTGMNGAPIAVPKRGGRDFGGRGGRGGGGGDRYDGEDNDGKATVRLKVANHYIGALIGKKGAFVKEIGKETECRVNFMDPSDDRPAPDHPRVVEIKGEGEKLGAACTKVAGKVGEMAQSLEWKLVFLIPVNHAGWVIGKKGATIREIRGGKEVQCGLSQDEVDVPQLGTMKELTVYGPQKLVGGVIDRLCKTLAEAQEKENERRGGGGGGGGGRYDIRAMSGGSWGPSRGRSDPWEDRSPYRGGRDYGGPSRGQWM